MRIPTATYRLQLSGAFGFEQARRVVPFLHALGISDLYSSPIYQARPGSEHGYDVVAHDAVNGELGGEEGFLALSAELRAHEMGLLLDIVPNHMSVAGDANRRWLDVLENGASSESAAFFDIDWNPPKPELVGKVLLPTLPDQFGRVVAAKELRVFYRDEGFAVRTGGADLPLGAGSWSRILAPALDTLRQKAGEADPGVLELESIQRALSQLPSPTETAATRVRERRHELPTIKRRLAALHAENDAFREALASTLSALQGDKNDMSSFAPLVDVLAQQSFRLSSWRVAAHEINYRRFFDVNDLAAIRVEDKTVFAVVHALPLRLAQQGHVTGLRIDHVDGLYDPLRYLQSLQSGWEAAVGDEAYLVVEKVLGGNERLPAEWPVAGTTGYDFLNLITGVLVDVRRAARLRSLVAPDNEPALFEDIAYDSKQLILRTSLVAELTVLARRLDRISEQHIFTRDFTRFGLQETLAEVIACFPVYRTYIRTDDSAVGDQDRAAIEEAVTRARRRNPVIHETLFDFLRSVLLLENPSGLTFQQQAERRDFVMRFQQLTGPVMAKGVEDTAFYRYFPLAALEEVGGNPEVMGTPLDQFHRSMVLRAGSHPDGLSATDTHDAKRSEDVRARLAVLSEIPEEWDRAVDRWRELNRRIRVTLPRLVAPDDDDEYLFYQTLLGLWPLGADAVDPELARRISDYMMKAIHEAKRHTSWINPHRQYDTAVGSFVEAALDARTSSAFLADVSAFARRIELPGLWNGLAQVAIKAAAPGVPDFYQGTELWSFRLVDPDNRRPVDLAGRQRLLLDLLAAHERSPIELADELLRNPMDGRIKLLVTALALRFRRRNAELFQTAQYVPCSVTGRQGAHTVAFARTTPGRALVAVAGRFFTRLGAGATSPVAGAWSDGDVVLPAMLRGATLREVFTGRRLEPRADDATRLPLQDVLAHLPVAWIEAQWATSSGPSMVQSDTTKPTTRGEA